MATSYHGAPEDSATDGDDEMTMPLEAFGATPFDPVSAKILDAAIAEFTDFGLRRVSVDDIAARAGVHRTTVYRYFKTKQEILQAAAARWIQDLFAKISAEVDHLPNLEDRLVEGFATSLGRIRDAPLVKRILETDTDAGLRAVTVDGAPAMAMIRAIFAHWFGELDGPDGPFDAEGIAEVTARLGLSLVLTPDSHFALDTQEDRREFARHYLLPLVPRSLTRRT